MESDADYDDDYYSDDDEYNEEDEEESEDDVPDIPLDVFLARIRQDIHLTAEEFIAQLRASPQALNNPDHVIVALIAARCPARFYAEVLRRVHEIPHVDRILQFLSEEEDRHHAAGDDGLAEYFETIFDMIRDHPAGASFCRFIS
jgi:hypothetical protein